MKRSVITEQFRKFVDLVGERGKAKLSIAAKCGHSTIEQMYRGTYDHHVSDSLSERIVDGLNELLNKHISEDQVFSMRRVDEERAS